MKGCVRAGSFSEKPPRKIQLRYGRVNSVLGTTLTPTQIESVFQVLQIPLGEAHYTINVDKQVGTVDYVDVFIPSFRGDLQGEADLIEEVARIVGLKSIKPRIKMVFSPVTPAERRFDRDQDIRRYLVAAGFFEAVTPSLIPEKLQGFNFLLDLIGNVYLKNPLSGDANVMRNGLLGVLLRVLQHNMTRGNADLRFFELGKVYQSRDASVEELHVLGMVMTGRREAPGWDGVRPALCDWFDLKGVLSGLTARFRLPVFTFHPVEGVSGDGPRLLDFVTAMEMGRVRIGWMGVVSRAVLKEFDLKGPVWAAELRVHEMMSCARSEESLQPLPKFPAVQRDMAMVVDQKVSHESVLQAARQVPCDFLEAIELFDVFTDETGQKVPAGKKSMAYAFTYRAVDRTLTDKEVNEAHEKIKKTVVESVDGTLREG